MRGFFNQHLDFYEDFYLHFPQRLSYRSATKCAEVALKWHRYRQVCIRVSLYPSGSHGKPARVPGVLPASPPTPSTEDDHLQSNYQTCLTGAKLRAELFRGWAVQRERISPDGQFPLTCPPSSNPAQSCCVGWCRGTSSVPGSLALGIRNDSYRGPSWFPAQLRGLLAPRSAGSSLTHRGPPVQALGAELSKIPCKSQGLTHPPRCSGTAEQERLAQILPG